MEPLFRRIDERLLQIPGVRMVAPALYAPMTGDSWNEGIRIAGRPEPRPKEDTGAGWARVMPGFFETIGAKIVLGRPITEQDTATTRHVAVVNEAFARRSSKTRIRSASTSGLDQIKYSGKLRNRRRRARHALHDLGLQGADPAHVLAARNANRASTTIPQFKAGEIWSHYLYNIVIWAPGNPPVSEDRGAQSARQRRSQPGALRRGSVLAKF